MCSQPVDNSAIDRDGLLFAAEEEVPARGASLPPWKILVVDDDEGVHTVTRMVLRDLSFENRPVARLEAYSGEEALTLLAANPDTAIVLLDVVMETEHSGLDVVRHIRNTLGNRLVRIILRTGQPGHAPERSVIIDYDINDYKEKTELTAQKLMTAVIAALRSHRDLLTIERSRRGLEKIIEASRKLFEPQSLIHFSSGVLEQLTAFLHLTENGMLIRDSGLAAKRDLDDRSSELHVLAGTGRFADMAGLPLDQVLSATAIARLKDSRPYLSSFEEGTFIGHFLTCCGAENFVYVETEGGGAAVDADLLNVFSTNIGMAFDNVSLQEELAATQTEVVDTLSELVETRSNETGRHVVRVGELSGLLAQLAGLDQDECQLLRLTSPMHDLGKIGIADAVLNKPGPLSAEEWAILREHTRIGHRILADSRRPALRTAALIALQHHERWDGTGYPAGLAGEGIHLFGRIVGLIDVFDALSHTRCYKEAWEMSRILDYIRDERGKHFDPDLLDLFLEHREPILALWERYRDLPQAVLPDPGKQTV